LSLGEVSSLPKGLGVPSLRHHCCHCLPLGRARFVGRLRVQTEVRRMPHLGVPELLIIMVIFVLVFGVGKLPQIGKALGQGIREFREATHGLGEEDVPEASSNQGGEA